MAIGLASIWTLVACLHPDAGTRTRRKPEVSPQHIAQLVADLADDDIRFNAEDAALELERLGVPAIGSLEAALDSEDWQQRQCAAHVLCSMKKYEPTNRMIEVIVEGLRDDDLPLGRAAHGEATYNFVFNAVNGVSFLLKHTEQAKAQLVEALDSDDHQQRFLAAYLLGYAGYSELAGHIAPILIPHLRDNTIAGDACMSASALYRLGDDVVPYLATALPESDQQQRELIHIIVLDFRHPPKNEAELRERKDMHNVSDVTNDPAIEHRFRRGGLEW